MDLTADTDYTVAQVTLEKSEEMHVCRDKFILWGNFTASYSGGADLVSERPLEAKVATKIRNKDDCAVNGVVGATDCAAYTIYS